MPLKCTLKNGYNDNFYVMCISPQKKKKEKKRKRKKKRKETYNPPTLNQEEIENLNRLIISNKTESISNQKTPNKQNPGPDGFTGEFHQILKGQLILIFRKLS